LTPTCPIPGARGFSRIEGTGSNGVLILGEAMGEQELNDGGYPFRPWAPAGSVLERAIRRAGWSRESFLIWNAIPTHPPGNNLKGSWLSEALAWGRWHLEQVIAKYHPRAILALGNIAAHMAIGKAGDGFNIGLIEGYPFPSPLGPVVVPSFHPSFLRRGEMSHFGCLLRDIGLAADIAREGRLPSTPPEKPPEGYVTNPSPADAEGFFCFLLDGAYPDRPIAYDIETPYSRSETEEEAEEAESESDNRIESIQFSLAPGSGIFLPWREPYTAIARKVLALPNPKLGWNNWRFDDPRLRANGVSICGPNHDLMWAWHHLQPDLPRGLQFAAGKLDWPYAWKHLAASRPEFYGITDVDVLQTIWPRLSRALKDGGLWRGYERHILKLEPILAKMSARGMPVDPARYSEVRFELSCRVDGGLERLQALVPIECKTTKTYKKKPTKILPWKPSTQQLTKYAEFRGHEIPRDFKTKKVTFDQLHLKRLYAKTRDPLYQAILEYKDATTVLSNHIVNWKPDDGGRVHSTFYYDPATGQLSSRRPNIQNAPKHKKEQGDLFRSIIRAPEGRTLIEFDYKSFHALTLGFEACDPDYMRLARLDIHSYVTAHLLRLAGRDSLLVLPDGELSARLTAIKREHKTVRDTKAKRAILGYGFGLGYKKLYEMNREDFSSQSEAKNLLAMLDVLFPRTARFRQDVRIRAHEQGYLVSRHGYIRRFWEVFRWEHSPGGGKLVPGGEESEAAIAFLPANDAFGRIKEAILELESIGCLDRYGFINTIHDSLLFDCPDNLVEECLHTVWPVMEKPSQILVNPVVAPDGLACEVSASVGKSWEKMEELKRYEPFSA
jgi:uracil-DNA glycosylase family 4